MITVKYWCDKCGEQKYPGFARIESSDEAPDEFPCPDCGNTMAKGIPKNVNFGDIAINEPIRGEM